MITQQASRSFLVFELLVKVGENFVQCGLFATEESAEREQAKLNHVRFPVEYCIKPRLVEV